MRAYAKELYSIKSEDLVILYNFYKSLKDECLFDSAKKVYKEICNKIRNGSSIENTIAIWSNGDGETVSVMVYDHKHEEDEYYTVQQDEEGKFYIEV